MSLSTDAILSGANTGANPGNNADSGNTDPLSANAPNPQSAPAPAMPIGNTTPTLQNPPSTFKGNLIAGLSGQKYQSDSQGQLVPENTGAPSVHGVFGSILAGALTGALNGATGARRGQRGGVAFGSGVAADQQIRNAQDQKAKALAQQNFQNKQSAQRMTLEEQEAQDKHNESIVTANHLNALTAQIVQQTQFSQDMHPYQVAAAKMGNAELAQRIQMNIDAMHKSSIDLLQGLIANGITDPSAIIKTWQDANAHIPNLVSGSHIGLPTGNTSDHPDYGVNLYKTDSFDVPMTKDADFWTYDKVDKNGNVIPEKHTMIGNGQNTVMDYLIASMNGQHQLLQQQSLIKDKIENQLKQAQTSEANSRANLVSQQAKQYLSDNTQNIFGDTNTNPANPNVPLTPKERDAAWKTFSEKVLLPLQTNTDKSYSMAKQAYDEYQKSGGKLATGAQSMMMLSQHLATTFGNVKGSRVTKDMISEHLGARSISDDAVVALNKLKDGDKLSPGQWTSFMQLIGQSREAGYDAAIDNARSNGLGKSIPAFLPQAPAKNSKIDPNTARIFMYASHGDPDTARKAADNAGWSF